MAARIAPASEPFESDIAQIIERTMNGRPPLQLFTTLARDSRLARKLFAGGLLDKGHLTIRQREIVIDRTTALCRSEYEWGVHIAGFGANAGLTEEQIRATVHGGADASCWTDEERSLIRLCDSLHHECDIDDALWADLRRTFTEEALIELLMLAGFYRTVSYLTNAVRLPLVPGCPRFPAS
ncbi:MAG: carboxymuconolactone decarboxylase family protein [Burkholderiaceae bacterium]